MYLLYHQPGHQLKVAAAFDGLGGIEQFAASAREQAGGVVVAELGHDGRYGLVQQG